MSGHPDLGPILRGAAIPPGRRRELLEHLRGCAPCRRTVAEKDPGLLFSILVLEPVPETILARVSRGARAAIARERRRLRRRRLALGSLAASLLLAGVLGVLLRTQPQAPSAAPVAAQRVEPPLATEERAIPAGMIELLDSPGSADVVEIAVGDVDVVMIFDEAMGI